MAVTPSPTKEIVLIAPGVPTTVVSSLIVIPPTTPVPADVPADSVPRLGK